MKLLVDVQDRDAETVMGALRLMSRVRVHPLTQEKARLLAEIRDAVDELHGVRSGTRTARPVWEFLDELPSPHAQFTTSRKNRI
jgi:hypothetical protein